MEMENYITKQDYETAFNRRFPPDVVGKLVNVIENSASESYNHIHSRFKHGNSAHAQGWYRRQCIFNDLQDAQLGENYRIEPRGYDGKLLLGNERRLAFSLIVSNDDSAAIIFRGSPRSRIPKDVKIYSYLCRKAPYSDQLLFPEHYKRDLKGLDLEAMPKSLKTLFFLRYFDDSTDDVEEGKNVGVLDAIVMDSECKFIKYRPIMDLRAYAAMNEETEILAGDELKTDLDMSFKTSDPDEPEDDKGFDLDIKLN